MKIFKDIAGSFYDASVYSEAATLRRGIGFIHMLMLTLIIVAGLMGYLLLSWGPLQQFADILPNYANELPAVTVKEGKLSIDKPVPYKLAIGEGEKAAWIVVDTTYKGSVDQLGEYMKQNRVFLFATEESVVTVDSKGKMQVQDLSKVERDFTVTHEDWAKASKWVVEKGVSTLAIVALALLLPGILIYTLIATFFTALVVMLLAFILRADIEFGGAMRMAALARIPATILPWLPVLAGVTLSGYVGWGVWLIYLIFAVWAAKKA